MSKSIMDHAPAAEPQAGEPTAIWAHYRSFRIAYGLCTRLRAVAAEAARAERPDDDAWAEWIAAALLDDGGRDEAARDGFRTCSEAAGESCAHAGALANLIFATPAHRVDELAVKLHVLRLAMGEYGATEDGDEELAAHQDDAAEPWLDSVMRDAARLGDLDASALTLPAAIRGRDLN